MSWLKWVLGIAFGLFALICLVVGGLTLLGASVADESVPPAAEERPGGGSQGAEQAPVAVSLGAEHTNPVGFAFQPPAGWQVEEENDLDNGIAVVRLVPPAETGDFQFALFLTPIELLAADLPNGEITLDAIAEYAKNATPALPPNATMSIGEPRRITIGGDEAVAFDLDITLNGSPGGGLFVAAPVNNQQQYFASISLSPAKPWQGGAVADAVLGTVRFTGGAGQ